MSLLRNCAPKAVEFETHDHVLHARHFSAAASRKWPLKVLLLSGVNIRSSVVRRTPWIFGPSAFSRDIVGSSVMHCCDAGDAEFLRELPSPLPTSPWTQRRRRKARNMDFKQVLHSTALQDTEMSRYNPCPCCTVRTIRHHRRRLCACESPNGDAVQVRVAELMATTILIHNIS